MQGGREQGWTTARYAVRALPRPRATGRQGRLGRATGLPM